MYQTQEFKLRKGSRKSQKHVFLNLKLPSRVHSKESKFRYKSIDLDSKVDTDYFNESKISNLNASVRFKKSLIKKKPVSKPKLVLRKQ
jgi:hypothetical protein